MGLILDERDPIFTNKKDAYDPKLAPMQADSRRSEFSSIRENPLARIAVYR
jgi:hypothetical protein